MAAIIVMPTGLANQTFSGRTIRWLSARPNRAYEVFALLLDERRPEDYPPDRTITVRMVLDEYRFVDVPKTGAALVYQHRHSSPARLQQVLRSRPRPTIALGTPPPRDITQAILDRLAGYRGITDPTADAWFNASTAGADYAFKVWTGQPHTPTESLFAMQISPDTDPHAIVEGVLDSIGRAEVLHVENLTRFHGRLNDLTHLWSTSFKTTQPLREIAESWGFA